MKAKLTEEDMENNLREKLAECEHIQQALLKRLAKAPAGKIRISGTPDHPNFYIRKESGDKNGKYLRKSETQTLQIYLQKSYDEKVLLLVKRKIHELETLLTNELTSGTAIKKIFSTYPMEARKYIVPVDLTDQEFADRWQGTLYEGKIILDNVQTYRTNRNELVRSKSELNIANALDFQGIPYKYECPLTLRNGRTIYPDFTVLDVRHRTEIYWEHRGMMDDREYAKGAVQRIKDYMKSGIVLGRNLIITEETAANPLTPDLINDVIREYFEGSSRVS